MFCGKRREIFSENQHIVLSGISCRPQAANTTTRPLGPWDVFSGERVLPPRLPGRIPKLLRAMKPPLRLLHAPGNMAASGSFQYLIASSVPGVRKRERAGGRGGCWAYARPRILVQRERSVRAISGPSSRNKDGMPLPSAYLRHNRSQRPIARRIAYRWGKNHGGRAPF